MRKTKKNKRSWTHGTVQKPKELCMKGLCHLLVGLGRERIRVRLLCPQSLLLKIILMKLETHSIRGAQHRVEKPSAIILNHNIEFMHFSSCFYTAGFTLGLLDIPDYEE
jgi:hypothetical protein